MPRLLPDGADNHNRVADLAGGVVTDIESTIIIKECLDCLTPRQREAVEYRAAGLKFFEIAAAMGIKERAVYRLIERAKSNIQELNIDVQ